MSEWKDKDHPRRVRMDGGVSDAPSLPSLTRGGLYRGLQNALLTGLRGGKNALRDTFLPVDYPSSVRSEYAAYQMWDSLQVTQGCNVRMQGYMHCLAQCIVLSCATHLP